MSDTALFIALIMVFVSSINLSLRSEAELERLAREAGAKYLYVKITANNLSFLSSWLRSVLI